LGRSLNDYIIIIPAVLLALTFHEAAHGYVAYLLGDRTAKACGRLTLNPLAHLDILGTLCMIVAGVGWAKPVPVDPRNFKHPRWGMALTALAGPCANVLLALILMVAAIPMDMANNTFLGALAQFFYITAILNTGLAVFNLLPVPPLDGSKLLIPFLPGRILQWVGRYEGYIRFALLALIFLGAMDGVIGSAQNYVFDVIWRISVGLYRTLGIVA